MPELGQEWRLQEQRGLHAEGVPHFLRPLLAEVHRPLGRLFRLDVGGRLRRQPGLHAQPLPGWAKAEQCHKNPGYTLKTGPKSCEVCKANVCEDKNATQCAIWGETECANNPGAVMRDCPKTCGVCTAVCADKEPACHDWAIKGECETNPNSMLALCPQSCGTCHQLEKYKKDEL